MKLIFNKNNAGNAELKAHLGFLDKSTSFENLERFIRNATLTVQNIIGKETYDVIQAMYEAGDDQEPNKSYIDALQDAICIEAYRRYAPSNDVGHTVNGRRMRVDDHEKQAFEWLIDRDNENMERMYYQSLDQLLTTLESLNSWKATDKYKKLNSLFVSKTQDFQEIFDINHSRYLLLRLTPGLRQAEQMAILPRLGKEDMEALKEDALNKEELLALVKEACVYWALSWAMKGRLTVTLFPEGVLQRFVGERTTTQGKQPPLGNEYAWAAQQFMQDAERLLLRIEESVAPEVAESDIEEEPNYTFGFDDDDAFVTT